MVTKAFSKDYWVAIVLSFLEIYTMVLISRLRFTITLFLSLAQRF